MAQWLECYIRHRSNEFPKIKACVDTLLQRTRRAEDRGISASRWKTNADLCHPLRITKVFSLPRRIARFEGNRGIRKLEEAGRDRSKHPGDRTWRRREIGVHKAAWKVENKVAVRNKAA